MLTQATTDLESLTARFTPPVLIISTVVGRGMYTLGEALRERVPPEAVAGHVAVEDHLPGGAVTEDLERYKWISNRLPFLLNLVYRVPFFYYRKLLRETWRGSDLSTLKACITEYNPRTILCVSHRPAFWVSSLKRQAGLDVALWGVLGEYGDTLGWRYLFWEQMDGFLSPLDRRELTCPFPNSLRFEKIELPARRAYVALADRPGDPGTVLVVCGYWGQGPIHRIVQALLAADPALRVIVVCGENENARAEVQRRFAGRPNVAVHGVVPSLVPFLAESGSVVTKPGISTLLEAHAARRKIFLLKGMPVAEDHNAHWALRHFGAEWFSPATFRRWREEGGPTSERPA